MEALDGINKRYLVNGAFSLPALEVEGWPKKYPPMKEKNKPFKITYFAKKHGKHITRTGTHDEKCKFWKSKKGVPLYTYFDLDEWGYRTATITWKVRY